MTDRPCDLNEPDGKPRRWHHSWERNNDDDSSNRGNPNADTQPTACATRSRRNNAEEEMEGRG
jgi:hypothetical protein